MINTEEADIGKILEIKKMINDIENSVDRLSSKLAAVVCKITELEAEPGEVTQNAAWKKEGRKQSLVCGQHCTRSPWLHVACLGSRRRKQGKQG